MKNKIIILYILLFMAVGTQAQYVLIPDSIFRHALITLGYGSCFDTTQTMLDTTCSGVLDSTELIVHRKYIRSIEGVQYFKGLTRLVCDQNEIVNISYLPPLLRYLNCAENPLEKITTLPSVLDTLECYEDQLDSLPTLPSTLSFLYCASNQMVRLPALPSSLNALNCFGNILDTLPPLPSSLSFLGCERNSLHNLPALPASLNRLVCFQNQLDTLPSLPAILYYLDCNNNQLTSLPSLPDSLNYFNCSYNYQLNCLPMLNKIVTFIFDNTAITCLPNNPIDNAYIDHSVPLCSTPCYPSGINNLSTSNLILYPNPATDKLECNFNINSYEVVLSDMTGRYLPFSVSGNEIDVSALPSGVYCLLIRDANNNVIKRFIKE